MPPFTISVHSFLPGVFFLVLFGVGGAFALGKEVFDCCITDKLGVIFFPCMALRATSFSRLAWGGATPPAGLRMWAIWVNFFLPDFVRALAVGTSELGVCNSADIPASSAAPCLLFLPDLGVFVSLFTPLGLALLRTFKTLLEGGVAAFFLDGVALGVFFGLLLLVGGVALGVFFGLTLLAGGVALGVVFLVLLLGAADLALLLGVCFGDASPPG